MAYDRYDPRDRSRDERSRWSDDRFSDRNRSMSGDWRGERDRGNRDERGFFAGKSPVPLRLEPVTPWFADQQWPMQFDVSVGVRKDDQKLLKAIDRVLVHRRRDIDRLLAAYRVPLVSG